MGRGAGPCAPALEVRALSKRYGSVRALDEVSFTVAEGSVHALVGVNGAGKSTCLGILAGLSSPSSGSVAVLGRTLPTGSPRAARRAGIAAVYQELMMVPALSTQANVFLGHELARIGVRSERLMRARFLELCARLKVTLPADVPVGSLSVADQQLVEIIRALLSEPRILLFDEPTASLAPHEREALFEVIRDLRRQGVTVVIVSHNLDEVLAIADTVTVFRDGRVVTSEPATGWTKGSLVRSMLGHERIDRHARNGIAASSGATPPVLEVESLEVPGVVGPVSLAVRPGEIVGVGGLVGSGRTTLLRAMAGLEPHSRGHIRVEGREAAWPRSARDARRLGLALVPEDRAGAGLFQHMSAADNIVISDIGRASSRGLVSRSRVRSGAAAVAGAFGIDRRRLSSPAGQLSGGNQQKLLLARWGYSRPRVLLADEPTRGVDVGAKDQIVVALRRLATEGMAVVMVSSELEELVDLADRIVVLSEGRMAGQLARSDDDFGVSGILHMAFGAEAVPAPGAEV